MLKTIILLSLAACGSPDEGLDATPDASTIITATRLNLTYEALPDSFADPDPFVIANTTVEGDERAVQLEATNIADDRTLTITLDRQVRAGQVFTAGLAYEEVESFRVWHSVEDSPNGSLVIDSVNETGFTFTLEPHLLVDPSGPITTFVQFEGRGEVAFP